MLQKTEKEIGAELEKLQVACTEKLGSEPTIVKDSYKKELAYMKKVLPNLDKISQANRAFVRTKAKYKDELRSPAIFFEGVVMGVSAPFDMVGSVIKAARQAYKVDPQKAIAEGIVDVEGKPLDTRTHFKSGKENRSFGKPLPDHSWIKNVFGIASGKDLEPKTFKLVISDDQALEETPMWVPVTFRANLPDLQPNPNEYKMNPSTRLQFEVLEQSGMPELTKLMEDSMLERYKVPLSEVPQYHMRTADDPQRIVIVEGDVSNIAFSPNAVTGNKMLVLDDESLPTEHPGVTCWVPEHLFESLNFGKGSRAIVVGQTTEAMFQGEPNHLINVLGVYAIPELRIPPDEVSHKVLERSARQIR